MTELARIETSTQTRKYDESFGAMTHSSHVRLFPSSPGVVSLQIRSEGRISNHGTKSWQCYSTAMMDLEAAQMLHAALQIWIEEQPAVRRRYEEIVERQERT